MECEGVHGFGERWCAWIIAILSSTSSKILVNGHTTERVWHRRGLRQGDPLSPLIFVLAMDVLAALFVRADQDGLFGPLEHVGVKFRLSLFADDVALLIKPVDSEVRLALGLFELFGDASGMCVNFAKSTATLIRCDAPAVEEVQPLLPCGIVSFPCTYLGLPLSPTRISKNHLQPYVDKLVRRLPSWMGSLLAEPGRVILIKAVLTAMSIYLLLALDVPTAVIEQLESICRGFLWCGEESAKGGSCPIAWHQVCLPTRLGGLGIRNLHILNDALRMKWLWLCRADSTKPWSGRELSCSKNCRDMFDASVCIALGNGQSCLFWTDRWITNQSVVMLAPAVLNFVDPKIQNMRTVEQGLNTNAWVHDIVGGLSVAALGQFLTLWNTLVQFTLVDSADRFEWRWTSNKVYSARSAYLAFFEGRTVWPFHVAIWDCKAPLKYKLFAWKAAWNRCWT